MLEEKISLISDWRSKSEALPQGSAPFTCSAHFKLPSTATQPKARNIDHRFSIETGAQRASTLKAAASALTRTDMITLGTARPSPEYYPWNSIFMQAGNSSASCKVGEEAYDLSVALNYGYAGGSPQLLRFITEHVQLIHNPPYDDWESCLTCGTTSALDILLRIFCNWGDWIITEQYTYSGAKDAFKGHGLQIMGVEMDEAGLLPTDLDKKLQNWDETLGRKPFLLYIIPTGHNPTGVTQTLERRKAIYEVAERHDLYIVEDDPYYFLQLGETGAVTTKERPVVVSSTGDEYLDQLPPSYLSFDTSGRVVRLDSTAKVLAPGLRLGWLTASAQTVQKFLAYTELGALAPSGPSQVMAFKLLDESWGHRGLLEWLIHLSIEYCRRRKTLIDACKRHLPNDVCRWITPSAGMFLWISLDRSKHPLLRDIEDGHGEDEASCLLSNIEDRIYIRAKDLGVLISKGSWFAADSDRPIDLNFRLTFAAAPNNDLEEAVARLGKAIDAEFKLDSCAKAPCSFQ
ncbi:hypothetical protein N0V90_000411 [Kalmusia sp. IMI 367209]|nr:hypothetical protein N0V90_000411 [Kalmusia sp. IMI 367209]